jgi:hypothetical protein
MMASETSGFSTSFLSLVSDFIILTTFYGFNVLSMQQKPLLLRTDATVGFYWRFGLFVGVYVNDPQYLVHYRTVA